MGREVWKPIIIRGREKPEVWPYEISSLKRIRRCMAGPSTRAGRILKRFYSRGWRLHVTLSYRGLTLTLPVDDLHRSAFHRPPPEDPEPLRETKPGRAKGENHGTHKLTEDDVRKIRARYRRARKKYGLLSQMAREYRVSPQEVHNIVRRRTWTHLEEDF